MLVTIRLKTKMSFKEVRSITVGTNCSRKPTQSNLKSSVSIRRVNFGVPIPQWAHLSYSALEIHCPLASGCTYCCYCNFHLVPVVMVFKKYHYEATSFKCKVVLLADSERNRAASRTLAYWRQECAIGVNKATPYFPVGLHRPRVQQFFENLKTPWQY